MKHSRYLSAEQAARAQEQIQAGREFRDAVELSWEACEERADDELFTPDASDGPEAENGGSTRRFAPRPNGRSRR
jgi:hypothetical protein